MEMASDREEKDRQTEKERKKVIDREGEKEAEKTKRQKEKK